MEGTEGEEGGGHLLQAVVHRTTSNKNGVGILINKSLKDGVVDIKRQGLWYPIEVWRGLGGIAIEWLTTLFNLIFWSSKMPQEWRRSI